MKNFHSVSSFQASARFQKCFHLQVLKKISSDITTHTIKKYFFLSNQGRLREELFVKSRQLTVRKTRQVKTDFGKIFLLNQGVFSFCKKLEKSNQIRLARNLSQIKKAFGKKKSSIWLLTYIVTVQRSKIPAKKDCCSFL